MDGHPQDAQTTQLQASFARLRADLSERVVGQPALVERLLIAMLADGHLLVEGAPGLAKTTAIKELALRIEADFHRIQFTPDLLPSDLTGTDIYRPQEARFEFQAGPIFHNLLLADEINRAPPRTQSALLEAMAERQVSMDGRTHPLPDPFFVLATQNPLDLAGTYPLPDSQLDRFLLRISLGYPDQDAERALLAGRDRRDLIATTTAVLELEDLARLRAAAAAVHASDALVDYVQALVNRSRHHDGVRVGLSPRAGIALLRAARAHALMRGQHHVLPDDVQALFTAVAGHRLVPETDASDGVALARAILHAVPVD